MIRCQVGEAHEDAVGDIVFFLKLLEPVHGDRIIFNEIGHLVHRPLFATFVGLAMITEYIRLLSGRIFNDFQRWVPDKKIRKQMLRQTESLDVRPVTR